MRLSNKLDGLFCAFGSVETMRPASLSPSLNYKCTLICLWKVDTVLMPIVPFSTFILLF